MTLDDLTPGEEAVISGYSNELGDEFRLLEMGLIIGSKIQFIKNAPFGDPIQVRLRGYDLSLRRELAKRILLSKSISSS
ncbi:ferrous iron transport protein A [candidate division KSB1 bacterium]|nr:ferrous iron transport protein A [candidate division KSB1 bacterium]